MNILQTSGCLFIFVGAIVGFVIGRETGNYLICLPVGIVVGWFVGIAIAYGLDALIGYKKSKQHGTDDEQDGKKKEQK